MGGFAQDVMNVVILLRFTPRVLEPLLGPLFAIPNNLHYRRSAALHLPLVKERLALMQKKAEDPNFDWQPPNDYVTWHIEQAQAENNGRELQPEMLSRRLMPINFGAIHTTVLTITNCIFDLAASQPVQPSVISTAPVHPFEAIREEAQAVYHESGHMWCKQKLSHLIRADSALRESMRFSNFLTRGLQRKVVARNGVENKSQGFKLDFGAVVGMDVHSVMHDPLIYPNPNAYDPFRFVRQREEEEGVSAPQENGPIANGYTSKQHRKPETDPTGRKGGHSIDSKKLSLSATSGTFLPFGHGRHAW
jgi:cytochrome P450